MIKTRETEKNLFDAVKDILHGFKELKLNIKKNDDLFLYSFKHRNEKLSKIKFQTAKYFINNYTIVCVLWQVLFIFAVLILPFTNFIPDH